MSDNEITLNSSMANKHDDESKLIDSPVIDGVLTDIESSEEDNEGSSNDEPDYYNMDLAETLKTEIENGDYTCLICTGDIGINSKIWNCDTCHRVYDLDCIRDWSLRGIKANNSMDKSWKCPSCNCSYIDPVLEYRCWCKKVIDPFYNGLMPHSCGQTCGTKLSCIHGCPSMCHPGPHSECTAIGPSLSCECGKSKRQWPCVITPYEGWKCQNICGEIMPCGEHTCLRKCHSGLCGKCTIECECKCYCGKAIKSIACSERRNKWSEVEDEEGKQSGASRWIGSFSCGEVCNKYLDCGVHNCKLSCHSRCDYEHVCPLKPKENETCYCGKQLVSTILGHNRSSCEEPIPSCDSVCEKNLACGHKCTAKCHFGDCPPCRRICSTKCGCESQVFDVPCAFIQSGSTAKCRRRCTALMDCRRHRCSEVCCSFEKRALERERIRKKKFRGKITTDSDEVIETIHQCTMVCNRQLNCGEHFCQMTCHNGPCIPCLESSMDDWYCTCGRTVLRAPIRCGSMKPRCKYQCTILPPCGHPRVEHECHDPSVSCPKCPYLVEKLCVCGKETVKGVQCYRPDSSVSCGKSCTKPLLCGHKCSKVCHQEGKCETHCKSSCGRLLPCDHPHKVLCHSDTVCNPLDCKELVTIKCVCGNLSKTDKCTGKAENEVLKCNESCAIKERNRKLAEALQIDLGKQEDHSYNDNLLDLYQMDPNWGDDIEQMLLEFVSETDKKELKFPPMNSQRRMYIHLLAEEFHLPTYSLDSEPKRNVVVMKDASCKIPAARLRKYFRNIKWD